MIVVLVVLLRGGDGTTYRIVLPNANQLVDGNEVQVGGRRVGLVTGIRLTDDSRAEVELRIDDDELLPLRRGTTVAVRAPSLSGIANKVVSITPGAGNAPALQDDARLPAEDVTPNVDLDQIFNAFDPETRRGYQRFVKGGSGMLRGRERDARAGLGYFSTALQAGTRLITDVTVDQPRLTRFLRSTSAVVGALAQEGDTLTDAVGHVRTTVGALADERADLERTLDRLPASLRRASGTFTRIRSTLDSLDPLVEASRPVAEKAGPLLRELRPLAADLVPTIAATRRVISAPGEGNDLLELLARTPGLAEVAVPALRDAAKAAVAQRPQ
ncbi:MAG: MlaD family protein, partial [Solirubrobacteraceae bacterium]